MKKGIIKSFFYTFLFVVLSIKILAICILINFEKPGISLNTVEASNAIAADDDEEDSVNNVTAKVDNTSLSLETLSNKQSSFFSQSENAFLESEVLQRERAKLERERQLLNLERQQLDELKKEIDGKITQLSNIKEEVELKIKEQENLIVKRKALDNELKDKNFVHLLKIYNSMPPKKSAALIDNLDMDVSIKLLLQMKGENVGQILGYVSPEKAARISERLAQKQN